MLPKQIFSTLKWIISESDFLKYVGINDKKTEKIVKLQSPGL